MVKKFVVKASTKVESSISATPAKDRLWDMIIEDGPDGIVDELLAYITEDDAKTIWETITGLDFDDDNEEY